MTHRNLDPVELDYEEAISRAESQDEAFYLSVGLREYREMYKSRFQEPPGDFI